MQDSNVTKRISRGRLTAVAALVVVAALVAVMAPAFGQSRHAAEIAMPIQGTFSPSSSFYQAHITAADIDADGVTEILSGNVNGWIYCLNPYGGLEWGAYTGNQIQGAPACYDVDGDGKMEVFVGNLSGQLWGFNSRGEILSQWGWPRQTDGSSGANPGIWGTPAIGDIDGDRLVDIVVGSWGQNIYAWTYTGALHGGYPYDNEDSIWSSPALADIDKDGLKEIIIGADVSGGPGWPYPRGGLVYAFNGDLSHVPGWPRSTPDVIWSSPMVADVDGDKQYEVLVGCGFYWTQTSGLTTEAFRLFGWNHDGSDAPGFPIVTEGCVFSSPSMGDIDGDGVKEIVFSSGMVAGKGADRIYAAKPNGQIVLSQAPLGGPMLGSPCLADVDGDGKADIVVGTSGQMCAFNYRGEMVWNQTMGEYVVTSPAAGDFDNDGKIEVAAGTGDQPQGYPGGNMYIFETRGTVNDGNAQSRVPWPMHRFDPKHNATLLIGNEPPPPPPPANFQEYILLMNPGKEAASVNIELMNQNGEKKVVPWTVNGESRATVWVNEFMSGCPVSARVTSDEPIISERAMYFFFQDRWKGGHDSIGALSPAKQWYLAEGYTSSDFDTFVLVQNPQKQTAHLTLTFMREGLGPVQREFDMGPESRFTLNVKSVPGCENTSVSTKVQSNVPVIAERSMYFNYFGYLGGHNSVGVTAPAAQWYLPEGYTAEYYDTFILVQNPGNTAADVQMTFLRSDGYTVTRAFTLPANSRQTTKVDNVPGFEGAQVSTEVKTTNGEGVIAERAMYFNSGGRDGGHDSIGTSTAASRWYLAEGYSGSTFDTYVLVMNPGNSAVDVKTTFMRSDGYSWSRTDRMVPRSRFTIHADDQPGFGDAEFSTKVEGLSGGKVIAERAMYFSYQNKWADGHDSIGVTTPARTWYFAEGYTGM